MDSNSGIQTKQSLSFAALTAKRAAGLLLMLSFFSACDTKNVGIYGGPGQGPPITVIPTVTVPTGMVGGEEAVWSVSWIGGRGPISLDWNWGGGAIPNTAVVTDAISPHSQTVTMVNPSLTEPMTYTYTVRATTAEGAFVDRAGTYVVNPTPNQAPVINTVVFDDSSRILTVNVSDPEGQTVEVSISQPAGLIADRMQRTVGDGGPADVMFRFSAIDLFSGGGGTVTIVASDSLDGTDTENAAVNVAAVALIADTLIAVPFSDRAVVSDGNRATDDAGVVVVIATGVPANPFQYLNGVGLTIESDATFVSNSFNAGAPGGDAGGIDGFWTEMAPGGGFLLPPDGFIQPTDIGGGRERWDFNLTPVGGSDQTGAEGELFNCKFEFGAAGTYTFGFQQFDAVNRTYYQDSTNTQYFWGDISNAGVPNSVVVESGD